MLHRPTQTAAPAGLPVTAAELKAHLRVDHTDEDARITALLSGAVGYLDGYRGVLGRCIINQTWAETFARWPVGDLRLAFPDVSSVAITYQDADDVEQTLATSKYALAEDGGGSFIRFLDAFDAPTLYDDTPTPITVTYTAGIAADESGVPADLKTAIYMLAAHWFEHREAATPGALAPVPLGFSDLIAPWRRGTA